MLLWSCDDSYHVCWIEFILWIQVSKSYFKVYFWCAGEKVLTRDKRLSFHVSWSIALIDICFRSPYKTFLTPLRKVYDGSSSRFISTRISALPTYRKFLYIYYYIYIYIHLSYGTNIYLKYMYMNIYYTIIQKGYFE